MAERRHWLSIAIVAIAVLTGCGNSIAPTATIPGAPASLPTITAPTVAGGASAVGMATEPGGSPVAIPTRAVSGTVPTVAAISASEAPYVDPQGRFTITVPKDWQPRAPANPASTVLVSFDAPDTLASLTITLEPVPLGTTAKEFAANTDKAIAGKMTNYKKQGQESLTVGNVPAEALTYGGAVGGKEYLFRQVLVAQGTDGWSITFPLDPGARQRYGPVIDTITQSFAFGRPLALPTPATLVAPTRAPGGSAVTGTPAATVKVPAIALEWKPNAPIAAGVPVYVPDAGIIAQLNGVSFTTKPGGRATLGADEQFMIADITIWNIGGGDVLPLPEQFNVAQERGAPVVFMPETTDTATEIAGNKPPCFGRTAIAPGVGTRGVVVTRVPKQTGLLLISYQPGSTRTPRPTQFYVKP
jgi:hypothetical protein